MIISGIDLHFGNLTFSHDDLCKEISEDVANKILYKSGFINRFITSSETDIINIGREVIKSTSTRQKIEKADLIIVVSEYVQSLVPPPSSRLLNDFISDRQFVVDLNRGCSGFCEALVLANSLFISSSMKKGVIITAENYSKIISRNNRSLAPIFSDAIAFTFIEHNREDSFISNYGFDHTRYKDLEYDVKNDQLQMNGAGLLSFVKSRVIPKIKKLIDENQNKKNIEYFFAHQGSEIVIQSLNEECASYKIKAEFISGMIGNINSSSIPFVIKSTFEDKQFIEPKRCLLTGFGVGLSFCNILTDIRYSNDNN